MPDNILNYFQFNQMKFDELWLVLHFTRKSYFACPYRQNLFYGSKKIYLLKCEFSKTKFVQIGQCLTNWQLSKVAQNWQILIILIICSREMLIKLGKFEKLPIDQILSDLDKFC